MLLIVAREILVFLERRVFRARPVHQAYLVYQVRKENQPDQASDSRASK